MSVASLVWTKRYDSFPESYTLGDVARALDKRELLVVSTADSTGRRCSSFREVIRDWGDVKLKEVEYGIPLDDLVAALTGGATRNSDLGRARQLAFLGYGGAVASAVHGR